MLNAAQRRAEIARILQDGAAPVSASALAARLGVSRQVVVGDVALLRAAGTEILATPRGYRLERQTAGVRCTVACRHDDARLKDELYLVADCGCGVLDVIVEHPVYGQLSGQVQVFSRADADAFCAALAHSAAEPLCRLTDGVHLHTLSCPTTAHRDAVQAALQAGGFLL